MAIFYQHVLDHFGGEDHPLHDDQLEVHSEHYSKDIDVAEELGRDRLHHPELLTVSDEEVDIDFDVELAKRPPHWHVEGELDVEKTEERSSHLAFDAHVEQGSHSESDLHVVPALLSPPEFDPQTLALSVKSSTQGLATGGCKLRLVDVENPSTECRQDANHGILSASATRQAARTPASLPRSPTSSLNRRQPTESQLRLQALVATRPLDLSEFKSMLNMFYDDANLVLRYSKYGETISELSEENPYVIPYARVYIATQIAQRMFEMMLTVTDINWVNDLNSSGGDLKKARATKFGEAMMKRNLEHAEAQKLFNRAFDLLVTQYATPHGTKESYKEAIKKIFPQVLEEECEKLKPESASSPSGSQGAGHSAPQ
ncbi:hypothetical protein F5878DRAFT_667414 [Lentinula raphanica]|uniref:Uncharacterized protein n=1 Tax=Lentinula raphanica TaxID=153919 RepID=A0AA38NVZ8_9AGAR|nr:hypothetical protein F5878DRAFT_667414 [Lentinula raphanica]